MRQKRSYLTVVIALFALALFATAPAEEASPQPKAAQAPVEAIKGAPDLRQGDPVLRGSGGPDAFGYRWHDSDEPGGPLFDWFDITSVGTPVVLSDDAFLEVVMPITPIFYGVAMINVKICSNGYLTFGGDGTDFSNDFIPSSLEPNDLIAPFWDDLNPALGGSIHYYLDPSADRFIVQYTNIQRFGGSDPFTFQVMIYPDGSILFQYLEMNGPLTSATVGIENGLGTVGLQVAYDQAYIHDRLAVFLHHDWPDINLDPGTAEATVPSGEQTTAAVTVENNGDYTLHYTVAAGELVRADGARKAAPAQLASGFAPVAPRHSEGFPNAGGAQSAQTSSRDGELSPDPYAPGTIIGPRWGESVLLVRDGLPWNGDVAPLLADRGCAVTVIPSTDLATVAFGSFDLVYIQAGMSGIGDITHTNIMNNMWRVADYVNGGGTLLFISGSSGADYILPGGLSSVHELAFDNILIHGEHPIAYGLPPLIEGAFASHDHWSNQPYSATVVTATPGGEPTTVVYPQGLGRIVALGAPAEYYVGGGDGEGYYPDMELLWYNAVRYALAGLPGWLDLNIVEGTVPDPGADDLVLRFDASGLSPGLYTLNLVLTSNDPATPQVLLPVTLTVIAPPRIVATPPALVEEVGIGGTGSQVLTIENTGDVALDFDLLLVEEPGAPPRLPIGPSRTARAAGAEPPRSLDAVMERQSGAGHTIPPMSDAARALHERWLSRISDRDVIAFFDDMESGPNGWTVEVYGIDDLWHQTGRDHSTPDTSWWCGDEMRGDYETANTISTAVISPPIDLGPYAAPINLEFFEAYDTEGGFDECNVEATVFGSGVWTPLRTPPSGDGGGWHLEALDMNTYAGELIQLRFWFDTGDPLFNNFPGWFFDDVMLVRGDPFWLWTSPLSGTVPPGEALDLTVDFDATGLPLGDYGGELLFRSNDPLDPLLPVPVTLRVLPPPVIDTSPSVVSATVEWPDATTRSLWVENDGGAPLEFHLSVWDGPPPEGPREAIDVLMLYSNTYAHEGVTELRAMIEGYPAIASVDLLNMHDYVPTAADLNPYHAVIVSTNFAPMDPDATGDVLADYVDAGGAVVMTEASFMDGFHVAGRFLSGGYMPFELSGAYGFSDVLGDYNHMHAIMDGVGALSGSLLAYLTLSFGAEWVADWDGGEPLVATLGGRVVGVNAFYDSPGDWWTGDLDLILRNAVLWAVERPHWFSYSPAGGTVPGGGAQEIVLSFESEDLVVGDYGLILMITSSDPVTPEQPVSVIFHVNDNSPVLLSFSDLEAEPGAVTARWEVTEGGEAAEFRLAGSGGETEWDVPVEGDGSGLWSARDESAPLASGGEFTYTLHAREEGGDWQLLRSEQIVVEAPSYPTRLLAAHPNPFNPKLTVPFTLSDPGRVRLAVYDASGQFVTQLADALFPAGRSELIWDGRDGHGQPAATGIYFVRMEMRGYSESQKVVLLR